MSGDIILEILELLIEEIESEIAEVRKIGAEYFQQGNDTAARNALERVEQLKSFKAEVKSLHKKWNTFKKQTPRTSLQESNRTRYSGEQIPTDAFRLPILEVLEELGGKAPANKVIERVKQKVVHLLKPADYEPLPSGAIRWRKKAEWTRYNLVREGLMKKDSPRGIWEISPLGRKKLMEMRQKKE